MLKPARILFIAAIIAAITLPAPAADAGKAEDLTPETIEKLENSFEVTPETRAIMNAIANNDVKNLAFSRERFLEHNDIFNNKIDAKGVTDQESSGRCWLFAGLNIMRPAVISKYNLSGFEFSQNHLFFWDKLEKSNMFLEAIIETRDRDLDDRELQALVKDPVPDGGWWNYVVALIEKYGAVPKNVMPETKSSSATRRMNGILYNLMRHDAVELREMAGMGTKVSALRRRKVEMLEEVYRLLVLHLGVPPKEFTWRYENKDEEIVEGTYTPLSFYKEAVGVDLAGYVSLFDHPIHPYDTFYTIRFCRNLQDVPDMEFVNLEIGVLKELAKKALLAGEPVWFAADVGKEHDVDHGILARGIYDYESLYGVDASLTKEQRIQYLGSSANHAMVFIGIDIDGEKPVKWKVENSWGTDRGNKGYWAMYDGWFDEYVYNVIIHKKHISKDILALFKTKPTELPAWDPMRAVMR